MTQAASPITVPNAPFSTTSRPGTRREQVEWSRDRLLDAAAEVIIERGFRQTTATLVAQRAGYSREMVRVRFGSVTELARELLSAEFHGGLRAEFLHHGDPHDRLRAGVEQLADLVRTAPNRTRAALILSIEAAVSAPEFLPDVEPWIARVEAGFAASLESAINSGTIRSVNTAETAVLLTAAAIGGAYEYLRDPNNDPTRPLRAAIALLEP